MFNIYKIHIIQNLYENNHIYMFSISKRNVLNYEVTIVILSAIQGLGWSLPNRGDEVSMCHFKDVYFWLNNINGGLKMDPTWS